MTVPVCALPCSWLVKEFEMCGIVGLFLKDKSLEPELGNLLSDMLITMSDRGPDSAGIAVYHEADEGRSKITVQSEDADTTFEALSDQLNKALGMDSTLVQRDTHAVLDVPADKVDQVRRKLLIIILPSGS